MEDSNEYSPLDAEDFEFDAEYYDNALNGDGTPAPLPLRVMLGVLPVLVIMIACALLYQYFLGGA